MQRLHIHIGVDNLEQSTAFYSSLLGNRPTFEKPDYAKWLLDDPRINLSISPSGKQPPGINHLGIQTETHTELETLRKRLQTEDQAIIDEPGAQCCYAESNKHWVTDPSGVIWELFNTLRQTGAYGHDNHLSSGITQQPSVKQAGCCTA